LATQYELLRDLLEDFGFEASDGMPRPLRNFTMCGRLSGFLFNISAVGHSCLE
jgi:hypothetical protein